MLIPTIIVKGPMPVAQHADGSPFYFTLHSVSVLIFHLYTIQHYAYEYSTSETCLQWGSVLFIFAAFQNSVMIKFNDLFTLKA